MASLVGFFLKTSQLFRHRLRLAKGDLLSLSEVHVHEIMLGEIFRGLKEELLQRARHSTAVKYEQLQGI